MRRSLPFIVGTMGLFLGILILGTQARSQDSKVPTLGELTGSYTYAGSRGKQEHAIQAKVDTATAEMGRFVLKRAVPKLKSATRIPQQLNIAQQGGNVVIKMDDQVVTVPENGSQTKVKTPLGETARASFDVKSATLLQDTTGQKRNTFRFNGSGQLMMDVKITNSRLAGPIKFTLLYARAK